MTFITGSITNANPGPTLYALIETAATGAGWTLDDTVVIGGNTHKVLKSAAAGNTYGLDWYLDINFPTTGITGGMRFAPFEGYTAASDVGLRGPFGHVTVATIDATTYSRYGAATSALETNWTNSASASAISATLSTSAFTYWISITRNRIVVLTSLQPTTIFYGGFFTPTAAHSAHAGAALFPLLMAAIPLVTAATTTSSIGTATVAFTRAPKAVTINWATSGRIFADPTVTAYFGSGQAGTAVSEHTGVSQIVPVPIIMGVSAAPTTATPLAANVGFLDGVAAGYIAPGAVRGDTLTVGADTWYATNPSSNFGLFLKGA